MTSIFFRWVGSTTNYRLVSGRVDTQVFFGGPRKQSGPDRLTWRFHPSVVTFDGVGSGGQPAAVTLDLDPCLVEIMGKKTMIFVDASETPGRYKTLQIMGVNYLSLNWFSRRISEPSTVS